MLKYIFHWLFGTTYVLYTNPNGYSRICRVRFPNSKRPYVVLTFLPTASYKVILSPNGETSDHGTWSPVYPTEYNLG